MSTQTSQLESLVNDSATKRARVSKSAASTGATQDTMAATAGQTEQLATGLVKRVIYRLPLAPEGPTLDVFLKGAALRYSVPVSHIRAVDLRGKALRGDTALDGLSEHFFLLVRERDVDVAADVMDGVGDDVQMVSGLPTVPGVKAWETWFEGDEAGASSAIEGEAGGSEQQGAGSKRRRGTGRAA